METVRDAFGTVYRAIRKVNISGYINASRRGAGCHVVDHMQCLGAPSDHVGVAERKVIRPHALDWAALLCDESRMAAAWNELKTLKNQRLTAPSSAT